MLCIMYIEETKNTSNTRSNLVLLHVRDERRYQHTGAKFIIDIALIQEKKNAKENEKDDMK